MIRESGVNAGQRVLVSCEGKSSLVVYESADFDSAVEAVVEGCFYSNGQVKTLKKEQTNNLIHNF